MTQSVLGLDYGTDSVRAIIVNAVDGSDIASHVAPYPRWKEGKYCDPGTNRFRQHPKDYVESLEAAVAGALKAAPEGTAKSVRGIAIDTTGSTPVAVDREGTPLALKKEFEENPNAMFVLWKDHTAVREADEINTLAKTWGGVDYTRFEGGVYSSEWFWAKLLHVMREDEKVRAAAFSWVEHCDWLPALLTGKTDPLTLKRSRCAAGHKAMWHESFGGLPSEEFLVKLDPLLKGLRANLFTETFTSDAAAGVLTEEWSRRLGIHAGIPVAVGAFDAHMGAVGGEIVPGSLVKVMGTSTCDMLIAPLTEMSGTLVRGICGQVDGSIVPGMLGMEAGQSAFGDVYAWFKNLLAWPLKLLAVKGYRDQAAELEDAIIPALSEEAAKIPAGESGIIALDWLNGRRTPDADQNLKGAVSGLTLGTDAPRLFRALVEATAFGSRRIAERFESEGAPIRDVIAIGGVAKKSPFVMQIVADVMNRTIKVAESEQTVALGAAMFAAVAAGLFPDILAAQKALGSGFTDGYQPNPANAAVYDSLYKEYLALGNFIEERTRAKSKNR
ncbi:MAG: ribulokinase [Spirochaetales bacterium]|nr:MAG: ribulokinase [Spirochaetales bacterium]